MLLKWSSPESKALLNGSPMGDQIGVRGPICNSFGPEIANQSKFGAPGEAKGSQTELQVSPKEAQRCATDAQREPKGRGDEPASTIGSWGDTRPPFGV